MKGVCQIGNQVIKCPKPVLNQMKRHYADAIQGSQPPYSLFVAKVTDCTITAYQSGKVMFQGNRADEEAKRWGKPKVQTKKSKSHSHAYSPPDRLSELTLVGSDEVGTGDYFGPITVCAVIAGPEDVKRLVESGVKDSKQMQDDTMRRIARDLVQWIPYSLLVLPNEKYNRLQQKGWTQTKMKAVLHNHALIKAQRKFPSSIDGCFVDQFVAPDKYFSALKQEQEVIRENIWFSPGAESMHESVAAASIIARSAFLREMDRLSEKAEMTIPKGAGPVVDQAAAKIIQNHGSSFLDQVAKVHFANTTKAKKLIDN